MAGAFDNFTSSLKGMIFDGAGEKAILYIYLVDVDKPQNVKEEIKYVKNLEKSLMKKAQAKLSVKDTLKSAGSGMLGSLKDAFTPGSGASTNLGETFKLAENELAEGEDLLDNFDAGKSNFLKFKVQYNPASIRLSTINGKVQSRSADDGIENVKIYNFTGKSKLSFDLIFDDVDNMNAFGMNELANLNISSLANKGINTFKKGKEGLTGDYSVKPKMDAILSLLCSPVTQEVVFFWSKMVFRGTITDVSNTFTMFNSKGNPIRGEMHLELTQDKKKVDRGYDDRYWDKSFEACFKKKNAMDGISAANDTSILSNITNNSFLNLNI